MIHFLYPNIPKPSMYDISYLHLVVFFMVNVGKHTTTMHAMGGGFLHRHLEGNFFTEIPELSDCKQSMTCSFGADPGKLSPDILPKMEESSPIEAVWIRFM